MNEFNKISFVTKKNSDDSREIITIVLFGKNTVPVVESYQREKHLPLIQDFLAANNIDVLVDGPAKAFELGLVTSVEKENVKGIRELSGDVFEEQVKYVNAKKQEKIIKVEKTEEPVVEKKVEPIVAKPTVESVKPEVKPIAKPMVEPTVKPALEKPRLPKEFEELELYFDIDDARKMGFFNDQAKEELQRLRSVNKRVNEIELAREAMAIGRNTPQEYAETYNRHRAAYREAKNEANKILESVDIEKAVDKPKMKILKEPKLPKEFTELNLFYMIDDARKMGFFNDQAKEELLDLINNNERVREIELAREAMAIGRNTPQEYAEVYDRHRADYREAVNNYNREIEEYKAQLNLYAKPEIKEKEAASVKKLEISNEMREYAQYRKLAMAREAGKATPEDLKEIERLERKNELVSVLEDATRKHKNGELSRENYDRIHANARALLTDEVMKLSSNVVPSAEIEQKLDGTKIPTEPKPKPEGPKTDPDGPKPGGPKPGGSKPSTSKSGTDSSLKPGVTKPGSETGTKNEDKNFDSYGKTGPSKNTTGINPKDLSGAKLVKKDPGYTAQEPIKTSTPPGTANRRWYKRLAKKLGALGIALLTLAGGAVGYLVGKNQNKTTVPVNPMPTQHSNNINSTITPGPQVPVQTPTQKPTQTPTQKPTQTPTHTPTQVPTVTPTATVQIDARQQVLLLADELNLPAPTRMFLLGNNVQEFLKQYTNFGQFKEVVSALSYGYEANYLTHQSDNFRITEDYANRLRSFTEDFLCAKVVVNNYGPEEMLRVFGNTNISYEKIMDGYKSFINTVSLYGTTATKPLPFRYLTNNDAKTTEVLNNLFSKLAVVNENRKAGTLNSRHTDDFIATVDEIFVQNDQSLKLTEGAKTVAAAMVDSYMYMQAQVSNGEALYLHEDRGLAKAGINLDNPNGHFVITSESGVIFEFSSLLDVINHEYASDQTINENCILERNRMVENINEMRSIARNSSENLTTNFVNLLYQNGLNDYATRVSKEPTLNRELLSEIDMANPLLSSAINNYISSMETATAEFVPFAVTVDGVDTLLEIKGLTNNLAELHNVRRSQLSLYDQYQVVSGKRYKASVQTERKISTSKPPAPKVVTTVEPVSYDNLKPDEKKEADAQVTQLQQQEQAQHDDQLQKIEDAKTSLREGVRQGKSQEELAAEAAKAGITLAEDYRDKMAQAQRAEDDGENLAAQKAAELAEKNRQAEAESEARRKAEAAEQAARQEKEQESINQGGGQQVTPTPEPNTPAPEPNTPAPAPTVVPTTSPSNPTNDPNINPGLAPGEQNYNGEIGSNDSLDATRRKYENLAKVVESIPDLGISEDTFEPNEYLDGIRKSA